MQVAADEVRADVGHLQVDLAERVRGIDDGIGAASAGHRDDLLRRDDEARLVVEMREQQELRARVRLERLVVRGQHVRARGGLGNHQLRHRDAAALHQPVHRELHRVVVEVGVHHDVARPEFVVLGDEALQRFRGAAGERDFRGRHTKERRRARTGRRQVGRILPARVVRALQVHAIDVPVERGQHRRGHHSEEARLHVRELRRHAVLGGHALPVRLVLRDARGLPRGPAEFVLRRDQIARLERAGGGKCGAGDAGGAEK